MVWSRSQRRSMPVV